MKKVCRMREWVCTHCDATNLSECVFCWIACNATDFFIDIWRQVKSWTMSLVGAVEVNAQAQGELRRFTQWTWIEHPTFQWRGISPRSAPVEKKLAITITLGSYPVFQTNCRAMTISRKLYC